MTLQLADGRKTFFDFREKAPLAATADMYLDAAGNVIRRHRRPRPSRRRRARHGRRPRGGARQVRNDEARRADRAGDPLRRAGLRARRRAMPTCSRPRPKRSSADPATTAIFLKPAAGPGSPATGWSRRTSAATLRQIARGRRRRLLQGAGGARDRRLEQRRQGPDHARPTSTSTRRRELAPVECDYRGYRIVSAPPPSSGGIIICEILNILEGYPLKDWGFRSAQAVHVQIEAMRHAYLDRNQLPRRSRTSSRIRSTRLLDKAYAAQDPRRHRPAAGGALEGPEARRRRRTKAATRRTTRSSTARATRSR